MNWLELFFVIWLGGALFTALVDVVITENPAHIGVWLLWPIGLALWLADIFTEGEL